jgi:hypothetical protein
MFGSCSGLKRDLGMSRDSRDSAGTAQLWGIFQAYSVLSQGAAMVCKCWFDVTVFYPEVHDICQRSHESLSSTNYLKTFF